MEPIFHITRSEDWHAAQKDGSYRLSTRDRTLEQEGFIHCSYAHQVAQVARAFYQGLDDLVVLEIEPERLRSELRIDTVETNAGEERFPHIYGPLNLDAVVNVRPLEQHEAPPGRQ